MNMYNQGTLTGAHKRELIGGFTLEQETAGRTEKVNFDKRRLAVFEEFLKKESSPEDYRAAVPEAKYKEPKSPATTPEVQRLMGIYTLKTILNVAEMLKDELDEEELPNWSDLAYAHWLRPKTAPKPPA